MAATSILRELSVPNPPINNARTVQGVNSKNSAWENVEGIRKWRDFTFETLNHLYGHIITAHWAGPGNGPVMDLEDMNIIDEDCFDHAITKYLFPSVNAALLLRARCEGGALQSGRILDVAAGAAPTPARRTRSSSRTGVPSPRADPRLGPTGFTNACYRETPTKLSKKWTIDEKKIREEEWEWPLRQIQHYGKILGTRWLRLFDNREGVGRVPLLVGDNGDGPGTRPAAASECKTKCRGPRGIRICVCGAR